MIWPIYSLIDFPKDSSRLKNVRNDIMVEGNIPTSFQIKKKHEQLTFIVQDIFAVNIIDAQEWQR